MKWKLRPEGGTFPREEEEVGERDLGGLQCACRGPAARGRHVRNALRLGPCGWCDKGATAAGKLQGLTMTPAEELRNEMGEVVSRPRALERGQLYHP